MGMMAFRSFAWYTNPEKLQISCIREPQYGKDTAGNDVYIGLGAPRREVTGSGVLTGEVAYDTFCEMQEEFLNSAAGLLTLPQGDKLTVYFTELVMEQDERPQFLRYRFAFREADDAGGIT